MTPKPKPRSKPKSLGQVAYEAYVGNATYFMQPWLIMAKSEKQDWQSAAEAVVRAKEKSDE